MNHTAQKVVPIPINKESTVRTGTVMSIDADGINIYLAGDTITAKKAFSCIIEPQPGDIVICTEDEYGNIYLLGIVERPGVKEMMVAFPCDTTVRVDQGSLNINSPDSVTIASENVNSFSTRNVTKSHEAIFSCDNIIATGDEVDASFKTVRLVSQLINTMAKQVIDRFKGYIRRTEESDMVKAGQINRNSDGLYTMDSKYTIMNSKKSTKIDGEKILMG